MKMTKARIPVCFGLVLALILLFTLCLSVGAHASDEGGGAQNSTSWAALQEALNAGGQVVLTQDLKAGATDAGLIVPSGVSVTLDLNGCILDRGLGAGQTVSYGSVITVEGTLTVIDGYTIKEHVNTGITGGIITGSSKTGNGVVVKESGTFDLQGGCITGNNWGIQVNASQGQNPATANMHGGSVTGNNGGVFVSSGSAFNMSGGSVTDNTNPDWPLGGVYVGEGAAFSLGGEVEINGNPSAMSGNVCLLEDAVIEITAPLKNKTPIGVTMRTPGVFTTGANFSNETAQAAFSSEDDFYMVAADENGQAKLTEKPKTPVSYVNADLVDGIVLYSGESAEYYIDAADTYFAQFANDKTYVVSGDTDISYIMAIGDVRLILCDGATLSAGQISVSGGVLDIYAQKGGTGALNVSGPISMNSGAAIVIHGGTVTSVGSEYSAGVSGGSVTVYNGTVTATGGTGTAGIGSDLTIYGGAVTATGDAGTAGISGTLNLGPNVSLLASDDNSAWTNVTGTSTRKQYMKAVSVFGTPDFVLPANLVSVEANAFEGADMTTVYIPDTCTSLGAEAFKSCGKLTQIRLPKDCAIGDGAFDGCTGLTVFAPAGGTTQSWCGQENIPFTAEESAE